ncbi:MAG: NAD-dependent epimerase/dehydratase family protein [Myxococcales bacterium]|nr:NAD-dependent epimerase/dehydratase family protein [Myxococcales bacterium]
MRALVTGGGGFLGRTIVEQLLIEGSAVRVIARGRYPEVEALGVEVHSGDLADADAARRAVQDVDVVFHVAAKTGVWGKRADFVRSNVEATSVLLRAMGDAGTPRLVCTSSPSVIFDGHDHVNATAEQLSYPASYMAHYPETKAEAERLVLAANSPTLSTICLRPHLIWGARDPWLLPRVIARHRAGRLRIVGDGTNRVSLSYVDNAAAAHLQAARALATAAPCAGRAFFVNDPEPVLLWPWINRVFREVGLPELTATVPYWLARSLGAVAEGVWTMLGREDDPPMTRFVAAQLATSHTYDVRPAIDAFAYAPVVGPEEGLERMFAAWRSESPGQHPGQAGQKS